MKTVQKLVAGDRGYTTYWMVYQTSRGFYIRNHAVIEENPGGTASLLVSANPASGAIEIDGDSLAAESKGQISVFEEPFPDDLPVTIRGKVPKSKRICNLKPGETAYILYWQVYRDSQGLFVDPRTYYSEEDGRSHLRIKLEDSALGPVIKVNKLEFWRMTRKKDIKKLARQAHIPIQLTWL